MKTDWIYTESNSSAQLIQVDKQTEILIPNSVASSSLFFLVLKLVPQNFLGFRYISFTQMAAISADVEGKPEKDDMATRYKCQQCSFQSEDNNMLELHSKSKHESVGIDCDLL